MTAYHHLKSALIREFEADQALTEQIVAATTIDEIMSALASSYRAWLLAAAEGVRGSAGRRTASVEVADAAVGAREDTLLDLMRFFERTAVAARGTAIHRTGPRHLRVRIDVPDGASVPERAQQAPRTIKRFENLETSQP